MQLNLDTFKIEKKELLRMLKLSKKVTFKMLILSGKFQHHNAAVTHVLERLMYQ